MNVSYFDKQSLIEANNDAILEQRNRSLDPDAIALLDDDMRFPVVWSMDHNDVEVRCKLMLTPTDEAWLDVSYETFNALPYVTMPTH